MPREIQQTETFRAWKARLRDHRARTIVAARVSRLAEDLTGDVSPVGEEIGALAIHRGPGTELTGKGVAAQ